MSGPDRHEPLDPTEDWHADDPDVTRVVPRGEAAAQQAAAAAEGSASEATQAVQSVQPDLGSAQTAGQDVADDASADETQLLSSGPGAGAADDAGATQQLSDTAGDAAHSATPVAETSGGAWSRPQSGGGPLPGDEPTSIYTPVPTPPGGFGGGAPVGPPSGPVYGGPPADYNPPMGPPPMGPPSGPNYPPTQSFPAGPQPGPMPPQGPPPGGPIGPQVIPAAPTTVVVPPIKLPKAESRVALNAMGTIIGILLVFGGLILFLRYVQVMRHGDAGTLDTTNFILTLVGVIVVALAVLVSAWASWAAFIPGLILTGFSVWAMIGNIRSDGYTQGGKFVDKATSWAVPNHVFASVAENGEGVLIGAIILFASFAVVIVRASVRGNARKQLASIQS